MPKTDGKHQSNIEIQNCLNRSDWLSKMAILKILKPHLLPNPKSDWAQTWWEALGPHGDVELLKSFRSDIQDGRSVSHFENLQTASPPKLCWIELKRDGRYQSNIFRIAKIVHDIQNSKSDQPWWKALGRHGDLKLLNWFHSNIQDGCHGGQLENLETTSALER